MPTARTGDIETNYVCDGEGPPVVFVHGDIVDHTQYPAFVTERIRASLAQRARWN